MLVRPFSLITLALAASLTAGAVDATAAPARDRKTANAGQLRDVLVPNDIKAIAASIAAVSSEASISPLLVLGDSLSDTGRQYKFKISGWTPDPHFGYWKGRFSNGYLWIDYLQQAHPSMKIDNEAVGGSQAHGRVKGFLDVPSQLAKAIKAGVVGPKCKVVIWSGANDILNTYKNSKKLAAAPALMMKGITSAIATLKAKGVKPGNIFVASVAPMDLVPNFVLRNQKYAAGVKKAVDSFNDQLAGLRKQGIVIVPTHDFVVRWINGTFKDTYLRDVKTPCFNHAPADASVLAHALQPFNHKQVNDACNSGKNFKMFFDTLHPTAVAHCGLSLLFDAYVNGSTRSGLPKLNWGACHSKAISGNLGSPDQIVKDLVKVAKQLERLAVPAATLAHARAVKMATKKGKKAAGKKAGKKVAKKAAGKKAGKKVAKKAAGKKAGKKVAARKPAAKKRHGKQARRSGTATR